MNVRLHFARVLAVVAGSFGLAFGDATAQYCPVTSTYFTGNYGLAGCTIGTCWAPSSFSGSIPKTGTQYPSSNYSCATTLGNSGAVQNTLYTYEANGNLSTSTDPLSHTTTNTYDALNRLTQVVDPTPKPTKYAYNGSNTLTRITDPRSLNTDYSPNGFGETRQLNSPDTGITTYTYDVLGRLHTKQDARGISSFVTYAYDDIGRIVQEAYAASSIDYTYDQGPNGKGRLTTVRDAATTTFSYEPHGRISQKTQTVGSVVRSVSYHYDTYGRLDQLTYPSGMIVVFGYTNGKVTSINAAGQNVLTGALYSPFGAVKRWTWANNQAYVRTIDLDGRVSSYPRNTTFTNLGFDPAGRITSLTDINNPALNQIFAYDALDRLIGDTPGTNGTQVSRGYTYDDTGNRLTSTVAGIPTNYTTLPSSNRLDHSTPGPTYSYDPMGNIQSDGGRTFGYNSRGRMNSVTVGGQTTNYTINAFGQRVRKVTGSIVTIYVYDEGGQLLGEYDGAAAQIAEHIYFNGMPVAVMKFVSGNPKIYQVYPDHLGTPRAVIDPTIALPVWQWHNVDPFGGNLPNETPSGNLAFKYNLRFPGQYYDAETGLHYNYYRDYDPTVGRYVESDPIGLRGGLNTYAYSKQAPLNYIDPTGLAVSWKGSVASGGAAVGIGGQILGFKLESECKCNTKITVTGGASFVVIGGGIGIRSLGIFKDLAGSFGHVDMSDDYADCPDPSAPNGPAWMSGINVVFGGGGSLLSRLDLGRLKTYSWFDGPLWGFDLSLTSTFWGQSAVTSFERHCC